MLETVAVGMSQVDPTEITKHRVAADLALQMLVALSRLPELVGYEALEPHERNLLLGAIEGMKPLVRWLEEIEAECAAWHESLRR